MMRSYGINPDFRLECIFENYFLVPGKQARKTYPILIPINEMAGLIWQGIRQERSLEEIAGQICEEYEVGYEQALADAEAFCQHLCQQGYLLEKTADG